MRSSAAEERRQRFPDGALARELARLEYGSVPPSRVIASWSKGGERNQQFCKDLVRTLEHGLVSQGSLRETRVRSIDSEESRRLFAFFLRQIGQMERGAGTRKHELRVDGAAGFWGRTEAPGSRSARMRGRPPASAAGMEGAAQRPLKFDGASQTFRVSSSRPYSSRPKPKRVHCPKAKAGGLAQRNKVCTRTIGNWARLFRTAGFLGCQQPARSAEDATLSRRQGEYPYGIWRVLRALPSKVMQRLQLFWGELQACPHLQGERVQNETERVEQSRYAAEHGHERAPPRKRRRELERERMRGQLVAHELVRRPGI